MFCEQTSGILGLFIILLSGVIFVYREILILKKRVRDIPIQKQQTTPVVETQIRDIPIQKQQTTPVVETQKIVEKLTANQALDDDRSSQTTDDDRSSQTTVIKELEKED